MAGSGPSLRHVDTNLVKDCIVIAVNGSFLKFPQADYFISCDARCTLRKSWLKVRESDCKIIVCRGGSNFGCFDKTRGSRWCIGIEERIHFIDRDKRKVKMEGDNLIWGSSSAHCAVHFAHILGCNPIVLLGMDCCYEDGKQRYTDFDGWDDGFYIEDFKQHIRDGSDMPVVGAFVVTWEGIAKENPNINIINASGGKLKAFPRMELTEVLKKYA